MGPWFTFNAWWLFILSSVALMVLLTIRDLVRDKCCRVVPEERKQRVRRMVTIAFWALEGVALVVIALAGTAMMLSEEGIYQIVTPEKVLGWFLAHGARILIILLVGSGLWYGLKKFVPPLFDRLMTRPVKGESRQERKKRVTTLVGIFMGVGRVVIILLVIFMILSELDIPIGPVLAGFGIAGIAIGFGAQYVIRDLIAGIFILMENQYRVGDVVKIADVAGLVEEVNLRKTVLRDLDGIVHHIPNGEIKVASNYTRQFSRVNLNVSVAYNTDLDRAISIINRVGQELAADKDWRERIITPPQVLRVDNLGDSGVEIKILGDVKPIEQWNVMGELRYRLKKAFDAEGIEIPWPHTKVYFGNTPPDFTPGKR